MIESREFLKMRLYFAAKDGMATSLYYLLAPNLNQNEISEILNETFIEDDGQQCTPLIVAARQGHDSVVRMIVSKFNVNLEKEGTVKFDGFIIEGASALWCAAGGGHLNVVKTLVKAGADVNHATQTLSTPMRAACFDGRLDIVQYLYEHHADIHLANKYNNTCLMLAAYKGHYDVVSFLLENDANPNEKALCGATALHFACECGHILIVKELLNYDAELVCTNDYGMTPLKQAAERTRADIVQYLCEERSEIAMEDRIDAYELLGASYANDKDNYSLAQAYHYLHKTMEMRWRDRNNVIGKQLIEPIAAYENWRETRTLAELEAIGDNANALHMEALTIRERILGRKNPELPHPIIYRGAIFADNARFDRCIELWLHAIHLRQMNHVTIVKDLLRFAQVFSQILHVGIELMYAHVVDVLDAAILELEWNRSKIRKPGPKDDPENIIEEMECNIMTALYLITILTKLLNKTEITKEQQFNISKMVYKLNRMNLRLRDGQSLLHLACNVETPIDDFHISDICRFPCADTAYLLIDCGADVNAMDEERNTPLHIIVNYHKPIADFVTLHSIIVKLAEAGAHIDCVNNRGETPLDSAATGVADIILKTQTKLSLKCLAAVAIRNHQIDYMGNVPEALVAFIEMHGANRTRKKK